MEIAKNFFLVAKKITKRVNKLRFDPVEIASYINVAICLAGGTGFMTLAIESGTDVSGRIIAGISGSAMLALSYVLRPDGPAMNPFNENYHRPKRRKKATKQKFCP